jgi:hypothetical protein
VRDVASVAIGLFSGVAGVGGGIMTNIVMSLSGMKHKCVGRAAAVGVVVSVPATIIAALASGTHDTRRDPARLHRSGGVGLHRAGACSGAVVRRSAGEVRRWRHTQPDHGGGIAGDRRGDAAVQPIGVVSRGDIQCWVTMPGTGRDLSIHPVPPYTWAHLLHLAQKIFRYFLTNLCHTKPLFEGREHGKM